MNFEACLSLPRDPREAALIADNLEALARALREWPVEAWAKLAGDEQAELAANEGLFERLAARTAQDAQDPTQRQRALTSVEAAAAVLRVLWPEPSTVAPPLPERELATT